MLVSPEGHVDFEAPIQMTEGQKENFLEFMKSQWPEIEVSEVIEPVVSPIGSGGQKREWKNVEELVLLLGSDSNETVARLTGRQEMSVRMKRGEFPTKFIRWCVKKGYAYSPKTVSKKLVEEFLREGG